ncbi:MAG: hypothetical protein Fur0041_20080 [Bacteroidia bacterium]
MYYPDRAVSDVVRDEDGNYWISTLHNGLLQLPDLSFRHWILPETPQVTFVAESPSELLFSTQNGLVYLVDSMGNYHKINRSVYGDMQFLQYNADLNRFEYSTNGKLLTVQDLKETFIGFEVPSARGLIQADSVFLIPSSYGLYKERLRNGKLRSVAVYDKPVRTIHYDVHRGEIILGTASGVITGKYKGEDLFLPENTFFKDSSVISVCAGYEKGSWDILLSSGTIYRLYHQQVRLIYRCVNGLQCRQLMRYNSRLFCATNQGLLLIDEQSAQTVLLGKFFGLPSNDIESMTVSGENLLLSSSAGLVKLPADFSISRALPLFKIKGVQINDKPLLSVNTDQVLNSNDHLRVIFQLTGFSSLGKYEVGYRFSDNDTTWKFQQLTDDYLDFTVMPTGDHVLEIVVKDDFGRIAKDKLIFRLTVMPPFWQRGWFYALGIVVILIITFIIFRIYIERMRRNQLRELRQMKLENDLRLSQQTALTAQMNPHFIFNVLNSIKGFIYENDKKQASLYLDRFSDLVRKVLYMSKLPAVKMEQELELIRLYVELESLQLDSSTEYIEDFDVSDIRDLMIPSLLIQPYIENAFKHGLRHKKGVKRLNLTIRKETQEKIVYINIEYNGVGRQASAEINKDRNQKHASFASGATERRIRLLNDQHEGFVGVLISDVTDDSGKVAGTRVELKIHLD